MNYEINSAIEQLQKSLEKVDSAREQVETVTASYAELEIASNALKNYKGDTNSADYRKLLADKEKAQKNHDVNREKYKELARREDQLKRYANRHPEVKKNTSSASTSSPSSASTSSPSSASSTTRRNNQSVFGNISNGSDDGNPYENGHGQFTADSISESANNDNPYENPNYYNNNGNSRNIPNSNSEDDNPYTNPNYYNDNNQASNNNNDDDEFDGSNYY